RDKPTKGEEPLDPERLPHQLKQWAQGLAEHVKKHPDAKVSWDVTLELRRHREGAGPQFKEEKATLTWDDGWRFDRAIPVHLSSPLAIPELGLAYQVETTVAAVEDPQSPLKAGDVIKNIKFDMQGAKEEVKGRWQSDDLEDGQWAQVALDV